MRTFLLEFRPNSVDSQIHKVRNLGEDLWQEIERQGLGTLGGLEKVDAATNSLEIKVRKKRLYGLVGKIISHQLKAHFLDDIATIREI